MVSLDGIQGKEHSYLFQFIHAKYRQKYVDTHKKVYKLQVHFETNNIRGSPSGIHIGTYLFLPKSSRDILSEAEKLCLHADDTTLKKRIN